jgi:succinyl-diaminopimelate desuccinylase
VVYGPTPHNIAAPDEYVEVADLVTVAKSHALTMARLLTGPALRRGDQTPRRAQA